jgi:hypothetical protein
MLMLPRRLYETLPYLYILTGVVSALLINSRLVIIASALMIMAGAIIISMRVSYRRGPVQRRVRSEDDYDGVYSRRFLKRSGRDRRQSAVALFPLIDSAGNSVEFDRRNGDRRLSAA